MLKEVCAGVELAVGAKLIAAVVAGVLRDALQSTAANRLDIGP
jgi:hypothetical protein